MKTTIYVDWTAPGGEAELQVIYIWQLKTFCRNIERSFIDIVLLKSKLILVRVFYWPPAKPEFKECLNSSLKESSFSNIQEYYLIGDVNLLSGNKILLKKKAIFWLKQPGSFQSSKIFRSLLFSLPPSIMETTGTADRTKTLADQFLTDHPKKLFRVALLKQDCMIMSLFTVQEKRLFWNKMNIRKFDLDNSYELYLQSLRSIKFPDY